MKLEWKGAPRAGKVECNEGTVLKFWPNFRQFCRFFFNFFVKLTKVLMLGDSMLRNMNVDAFGRQVHLFSYPGISIGQLIIQIKNDIMPPPSKIGTVFVHCGTNNASTVKASFR